MSTEPGLIADCGGEPRGRVAVEDRTLAELIHNVRIAIHVPEERAQPMREVNRYRELELADAAGDSNGDRAGGADEQSLRFGESVGHGSQESFGPVVY